MRDQPFERLAWVLGLSVCVAHLGWAAHHGPHPQSKNKSARPETAAKSQATINIKGAYRYIEANGLPNHSTGRFPNRGNPNAIKPQRYVFRLPLNPEANPDPLPLEGRSGPRLFGVALNGVVFDPGTAEWWNGDRRSGWNYEALSTKIDLGLDNNLAHVQPSGAYHYHGIPFGLVEALGGSEKSMCLLGYAADGFPIYAPRAYRDAMNSASELAEMKSSYRVKRGARPSGPAGKYDGTFVQDYEYVKGAGDLDECNGRTGVTPEFPGGTYYYLITSDFPFIPRLFRGTPDESFSRRQRVGPPGGRRRPQPPKGKR